MITIKTKEAASVWIGLLATAIAAGLLFAMEAKGVQVRWIAAVVVLLCTFTAVMLISLFIIRKYVAYKLKPIYSIVLSRNVHTDEIFTELKDKKVENIGEELTAWADTNDREIARLKHRFETLRICAFFIRIRTGTAVLLPKRHRPQDQALTY